MATFRNSEAGCCFGGGSVKNTCVLWSCLAASVLVGCSPAPGPKQATTVLQEDAVKVQVDAQGRPSVGNADAGKSP